MPGSNGKYPVGNPKAQWANVESCPKNILQKKIYYFIRREGVGWGLGVGGWGVRGL